MLLFNDLQLLLFFTLSIPFGIYIYLPMNVFSPLEISLNASVEVGRGQNPQYVLASLLAHIHTNFKI